MGIQSIDNGDFCRPHGKCSCSRELPGSHLDCRRSGELGELWLVLLGSLPRRGKEGKTVR